MQFIDLGKQYDIIGAKIREDIDKVLNHRKFINGPEVKELESQLSRFVGVKHVICCSNGTDALTIPLMAWQLNKNDAVFVPSFTFFASAEAITIAGGTPVFVDCHKDTFNIDPNSLRKAIEKTKKDGKLNPKGIISVDLFGQLANYEVIQQIAVENNLFLLEDGAQSFGASVKGHRACSFGDVATTSFFPAKPLGCYGDGGAIFTNDDKLAEIMNSIHVHGQGSDKYDNVRIGLNSRLDTIQAAILLAKMAIFPKEIISRNQIAAEYSKKLEGLVETPVLPEGHVSAWAQYTIKVPVMKRTDIIKGLAASDIPTMIYYPVPIHQSTAYKNLQTTKIDMSVTESLCKVVMSLPMHPYLEAAEIASVCQKLEECLK
jgi:dTDP-4-amino-4,6-dideoxygalactose transaminase